MRFGKCTVFFERFSQQSIDPTWSRNGLTYVVKGRAVLYLEMRGVLVITHAAADHTENVVPML